MCAYKYNKAWRIRNPKKRLEGKKRYYEKYNNDCKRWVRYSEEEEKMVLDHDIPDRILCKKLGRSMASIHAKRYRLMERGD